MDLLSKLKKIRILLVDGNECVRDSLSLFSEGEGWHLLALKSAEEGIEAIKSQDYDIIISDYKLPGMNGLEFIRAARKVRPELPGILTTACGDAHLLKMLRELDGCECLDKPLRPGRLLETIGRLMK